MTCTDTQTQGGCQRERAFVVIRTKGREHPEPPTTELILTFLAPKERERESINPPLVPIALVPIDEWPSLQNPRVSVWKYALRLGLSPIRNSSRIAISELHESSTTADIFILIRHEKTTLTLSLPLVRAACLSGAIQTRHSPKSQAGKCNSLYARALTFIIDWLINSDQVAVH